MSTRQKPNPAPASTHQKSHASPMPTYQKPLIPHIFISRTQQHTIDSDQRKRQRRRTLFGLCVIIFVIALITIAFNTFKGYQIQTISPDSYQITTTLRREDATAAIAHMDKTLQDTYPFRDIRLPDGTFTTITLDRTTASDLLDSNQDTTTFTSLWQLSDYSTITTDEEQGTVTMFVRITYQEIEAALQDTGNVQSFKTTPSTKSNQRFVHSPVPLPNGKFGSCWLDLSTLDDYRRRMHCLGATSIFLPFTWYLDSQITASIPNLA